MTTHLPRLPVSVDPLIAEARRRRRRRRLLLAALSLLGAGAVTGIVMLVRPPGGSGGPAAAAPAKTPAQQVAAKLGKVVASDCTAVSGGFRGCTVFHFRGEVSRIERRQGAGWSVVLAPDRAPYSPSGHAGYWQRVLAAPRGGMVLAQWSAECEVPIAYLVATRRPALRQVFGLHSATVLGWTSDGLARVKLLQPIYATKRRVRFPAGIYRITPHGGVVGLERRLAPAPGC